jgi:integrase
MTTHLAEGIGERLRRSMGLRREPSTITRYAEFAERFSRFTKKEQDFSEDDALRFIDHLIGEGYSDSSIKWSYYGLKRVYRAVGSPFTVTLEDLPLGRRGTIHRPVLSRDEIAGLIAFVRSYGSQAETFYLAMSTTYGLRRVELSRLRPESFSNGTVRIETAKHGEPRTHLVPSEIHNVVREGLRADALGYSTSALTVMFRELGKRAGLQRNGALGWHSIRRSLDTQLLDANLPYYVVKDFLRWKASPSDMPGLYHRPSPADVDRRVFGVHPFLSYWR